MTGLCLGCGFATEDLDALDEHVRNNPHSLPTSPFLAHGCWYCGAAAGSPCVTSGGHHTAPHTDRRW